MSLISLQPTRALTVLPHDVYNIPYPSLVQAGVNTSTLGFRLIDSNATFITKGVKSGDVIYNYTDKTVTLVNAVLSETTLSTVDSIFGAINKSYSIFEGTPQTGCLLHIGVAASVSVRVLTAAYEDVTLPPVPSNTFLPLRVLRVFNTGTTNAATITALW